MSKLDFGGPKLHPNDISVELGQLDAVADEERHPLGFTLATTGQFDALRQAVRATYAAEANRAPRDIRDLAPRRVNLYRYSEARNGDGILFWPKEQHMNFAEKDGVAMPHSFPLTEPVGLGLRTSDACDVTDELIVTIAHECRHLLTRYGIHMFNNGPDESLNAGLDNAYYPNAKKQQKAGISRERLWSTTGLNSPSDFGEVKRSALAESALYASAHAAFENVSAESLWEIWSVLTEHALSHKRFPFQAEVRAAVQHVLQERSEPVLSSPAFQPLTVGSHVTAFAAKTDDGKDVIQFNAFDIVANPHYGLRHRGKNAGFDSVLLHATDAPGIRYVTRYLDARGRPIPGEGGNRASASYWTSFERQEEHVRRGLGAHAERFLRGVGSMTISVGDLPPIPLTRRKG